MIERRGFLLQLGAFLPFAVARRRAAYQAAGSLSRPLLMALAGAALPSELGREATTAAVDGFSRWLSGYRPGAELLHGYGASDIRRTPPSPAVR